MDIGYGCSGSQRMGTGAVTMILNEIWYGPEGCSGDEGGR